MASMRCPGCGAKNSVGSVKCRLCGADVRGQHEQPLSQPKPGSNAMRSSHLGGLFALGVLGVAAIVLAGVAFGFLPGGDTLTSARNKIPFLAVEADDGWEQFTEPAARFRATLPVDRTEKQIPSTTSPSGTIDEWVSTLGSDANPDTELSIQWTTVDGPAGDDVKESLGSEAVAWAADTGGKLVKNEEISFEGLPARLVTIDGLRRPAGEDVTVRALLIRQRDNLFILESRSIYADHPQFDRLANGFALL